MLTWQTQLLHQLFLDEVMGAATVNQQHHLVVVNSSHQMQRFRGYVAFQRIEANLGWAWVMGIGWVRY